MHCDQDAGKGRGYRRQEATGVRCTASRALEHPKEAEGKALTLGPKQQDGAVADTHLCPAPCCRACILPLLCAPGPTFHGAPGHKHDLRPWDTTWGCPLPRRLLRRIPFRRRTPLHQSPREAAPGGQRPGAGGGHGLGGQGGQARPGWVREMGNQRAGEWPGGTAPAAAEPWWTRQWSPSFPLLKHPHPTHKDGDRRGGGRGPHV